MAGLDLPIKLRRGIGKGKVVPAEELTRRLLQFDGDGDGNLKREELTKFFLHHRVGGPWFCEVVTKTLWGIAEDRWSQQIESITADALGRVINYSMSRPARRTSRYVITPQAVQGLEDKQTLAEARAADRAARTTDARRAAAGGPTPRPRPADPRGRPSARPNPQARGPSRPMARRPGPRPRR